jgi:two-component system, sporulation sensor kinase A
LHKITEKKFGFDFRQIVEGSLTTNLILEHRTVVYSNQAGVELLGLSRIDDIVGKDFDEFLHPEFHGICKERLQTVTEKNGIAELMEQKLISSDGRIIDVEIMAIPYYHHNNKTLAQIVIRDITEKKKAQQLLMQSEKLAVIGELASGIVHDIRNPLTAIKGFLQLLHSENLNNQYIRIIHNEIEQIQNIANELLYLAKPKETNFISISIEEIIKETVDLFSTEAFKRKIEIQYIRNENPSIDVLGDKIQLKQVFINLIKNALEAIEREGVIGISLLIDLDKVVVVVEDNGVGIPKDQLNRIGQSFFTNKEEGTGLGLMVTYNIISNHNGEISIESNEEVGTSIKIKLPIYHLTSAEQERNSN